MACCPRRLASTAHALSQARLKRLLALSYPRGDWDFTLLFDAVLPDIDPNKRSIIARWGGDSGCGGVAGAGALPWWQAVPEADPFTLPEEDQPPN